MIAMPAIDLRGGACVQLVGGSYAEERVRLPAPLAVARSWGAAGFRHLHVVDLDAATGNGANDALVADLLRDADVSVQVGGGVRSTARLDELLALGATRVVTGTRALTDPAWLAERASAAPGRIVVAVDVRHRTPVVNGWAEEAGTRLDGLLAELDSLPLAAILVTAVHVEGREGGPDLELTDTVLGATRHPVIASGGIATMAHLRALAQRGVWAAVIGMALYTGTLDARRAAEEFGA